MMITGKVRYMKSTSSMRRSSDGQLRAYVTAKKVQTARIRFIKSGVYVVAGGSSFSIQKPKMKYMDQARVRDWPDLEGEVYRMMPGEAARFELKRAFPNVKRVGWRGPAKQLFNLRWPTYCTELGEFEGYYLDIKAAYWQIYRNLWLNVSYPCGIGSLSMRPVADRLENWKVARNGVIGIVRSMSMRAYTRGRAVKIFPDNAFLSPHLWATVQQTLHSLARVAESCGAAYCMTDGYLFTSRSGAKVFMDMLDDYEIAYRWAAGKIIIRGWMNYAAPGRGATKSFMKGHPGGATNYYLNKDFNDPFKFIDFVFKKGRRLNDEQAQL